MPLNVTVTANEAFADGTNVDRAALRRASKPTVSITGQIETADISSAAQITYAQLANVTDGYVLRGNGSNKAAAVQLQTGASLTSGGVLTPSTGTITGSHLVTGSTNAINGLGTTLATVDSTDLVMINDATDSALKKITVGNLLKAGVDSTSQSLTALADTSSSAATVTINMDGNPVQKVNLAHSAVTFANASAMPSGTTAKSVTVIMQNTSGGEVTFTSFGSEWIFLKSAPTTMATGKTAVLALTAFSSSELVAAYASEG